MNKELRRGLGMIEILLVLAIISFLFYKVINLYFKKSHAINKETTKALSEQGIDTTSYKSLIDTTKGKIQNIQSQHLGELENIE